MIFSARTVESTVRGDVVLGFNEPDNDEQSGMSVDEAPCPWPKVTAKAGTAALFDDQGGLTKTGRAYAAAGRRPAAVK